MGGDWERGSCHGKKCFIAVGVFSVELFQWSALQIGEDSSIFVRDVIPG